MTTNAPGGLPPDGDLTLDRDPSRPPAAAAHAELPREIGGFRILGKLGEGGMGVVYLAEHPGLGRKAAIKVLRREFAEDKGLVERFMNEARAANAIRHPNIIEVLDSGTTPRGASYLVMELLEGEALSARIKRL
ncbi:MAG TPA: protein kinase, partial [Thermoanaerobaculia bacterium]|nr:protein kinase [Thermoanaerobaculia bacterium]